MIEAHPGEALPPAVADHLARHLRGALKHKPGPKPPGAVAELELVHAEDLYDRYFDWLRARQRRMGLAGWPAIRRAEWWQGRRIVAPQRPSRRGPSPTMRRF